MSLKRFTSDLQYDGWYSDDGDYYEYSSSYRMTDSKTWGYQIVSKPTKGTTLLDTLTSFNSDAYQEGKAGNYWFVSVDPS